MPGVTRVVKEAEPPRSGCRGGQEVKGQFGARKGRRWRRLPQYTGCSQCGEGSGDPWWCRSGGGNLNNEV
jgi:hypothetical protein